MAGKDYRSQVRTDVAKIDSTTDQVVSIPAKAVWDEKQAASTRDLKQTANRLRNASPQAAARTLQGVASKRAVDMAVGLHKELSTSTRHAALESLNSLQALLKTWNISLTDSDIQRIVSAAAPTFRASQASSLSRLAGAVVRRLHGSFRAEDDTTVFDVADDLSETLGQEWWRAQRVVNTEISRVFNVVRLDALRFLAHQISGLYIRWTELVDDETGAPLDSRVAADSLILHAQVAEPGALFYMPPWGVPEQAGQGWMAPPNRPNDRAVLIPWARGCGLPAWRLQNGKRVDMGR